MSSPSPAPAAISQLTYEALRDAVGGQAAAFRWRRKLQPAGGPGDKVFPPTFAGAVYAVEKRRIPGRQDAVTCVLLDSVQSQANRMEQALQEAVDSEEISLPLVEVDFGPAFKEGKLVEDVGRITSLEAPHRLADAILRDSEYKEADGRLVPFRDSSVGKPINDASPRNATPIYQLCPTALLFGMWDSTGPKGGLGAKFERAVVSEVIGADAAFGVRVSSRIDPLITATADIIVYKRADGAWTPFIEQAAKDKNGKPVSYGKKGKLSEANLGNVLPTFSTYQKGASGPDPLRDGEEARQGAIAPGGVTFDYALQTTTLSLAVLRRLAFPDGGARTPARDLAGRVALAALGLFAACAALEPGLALRSRCALVPCERGSWELVEGPEARPVLVSAETARGILERATAAAAEVGLRWSDAPVVLTPSKELLDAAAKSQGSAREGKEADRDEG